MHGVKDASTDPAKIRKWWTKWPDANIGVAAGTASGFVALDVDPRNGGDTSLKALVADIGPLPETVTADTGGGGQHLLFAAPDTKIGNANDGLGSGLDVKADGGYIVVAPSNHVSGKNYAWVPGKAPGQVPIAPLPPALLERLTSKPAKQRKLPVVRALEGVDEGSRDTTLWSTACSLAAAGVPRNAAEKLVLEAAVNASPPFEPDVALEKVERAYATSRRAFEHSDTGNAQYFAALYGNDVKFDHDQDRWFIWTGTRWAVDRDGEVVRLAKQAMAILKQSAREIEDIEQRDKLIRHAVSSRSKSKLMALLDLAKAEERIAVTADRWDRNPWLLGVPNGVLDLRTGRLRAAKRSDFITRSTKVVYNPDAKAPEFERFIAEICGCDQELIGFIQRALGMSLTGDMRERLFFVMVGRGSNGKSTLLNVIRHVFGDYARNVPFTTFEEKSRRSVPDDLMILPGRRFVTASETDENARWSETRIKAITGGDPITARGLYETDWVQISPQCKLWFATNQLPRAYDPSDGFWHRCCVIPFKVQFTGDRQTRNLADHLIAHEGSGILSWLVAGCQAWQRDGLTVPVTIQEATETYRKESDPIEQFLEDHCIQGKGYPGRAQGLFSNFDDWQKNHLPPEQRLTGTAFGRRMGDRFEKKRDKYGAYYIGVTLVGSEMF